MLAKRHIRSFRGQARANNQRLSSPGLRDDIRKLLHDHGEIEVHCIHDYYRHFFKKTLCAVDMGYPNGLLGYLATLGAMIDVRQDRHLHFISLTKSYRRGEQEARGEDESSENDHNNKKFNVHKQLFDRNNYLWTSHQELLDRTDLMIEHSAYESAIECFAHRALDEVSKCRQYLENFADGIPLTEIKLSIDRRIFNVGSSINTITLELPEIFYRIERKAHDPLIFSGRTHTMNIEEEKARTDMDIPDGIIITEAINSGLYQQTLMLIKQTGVRGLKLNVWSASILRNFFSSCDVSTREKAEKKICDIDVIDWFLAFARSNLLEVQSSEQAKNDLRAFLPREPFDYLAIKKRYKNLVNEALSETTEYRPKFNRKKTIGVLKQIQQFN